MQKIAKYVAACLGVLFGVGFASAQPQAMADEFPSKPVRIIVPYVPGGPTDLIARIISVPLASALKQPVFVENRPGASGAIGTNLVAHAQPDGYTLLLSNVGDTVTVALGVKVPYDYQRDLSAVSLLGLTPFVLVVSPALPATTVKGLIQYAQENPKSINFGSAGTGSSSQLAGELFKSSASFQATHVPYKGQSDATVGLVQGQLTFMFANPVNALPLIQAGTLRVIAVSGKERFAALPQVPTVAEAGLPGYDVSAWFGLMTTGGVPAATVDRLNKEVQKILAMPDVRERLESLGVQAQGDTPKEFDALIASEISRWTKVVHDADIHVTN